MISLNLSLHSFPGLATIDGSCARAGSSTFGWQTDLEQDITLIEVMKLQSLGEKLGLCYLEGCHFNRAAGFIKQNLTVVLATFQKYKKAFDPLSSLSLLQYYHQAPLYCCTWSECSPSQSERNAEHFLHFAEHSCNEHFFLTDSDSILTLEFIV